MVENGVGPRDDATGIGPTGVSPSRAAVRQPPATSDLRVSRSRPFPKELDAMIEFPATRLLRDPSKSEETFKQAPLFPSKGRCRDDRARRYGDLTENAKERWAGTGLKTTRTTTIRGGYKEEGEKMSTSREPARIGNWWNDP